MNTNTVFRYALVCLVLTALAYRQSFGAGVSRPSKEEMDRKSADFKLYQSVMANAVHTSASKEQYRASINRLIEGYSDKPTARFIAAKLRWLSGEPAEAIATLEEAISEYGNAPHHGWGQVSNAIAGNLWIATMARHAGDVGRAQEAYGDILATIKGNESLKGLAFFCHLYESEMAETILRKPDAALEELRHTLSSLETIDGPKDNHESDSLRIYHELIEYLIASRTKGVSLARAALMGDLRKYGYCVFVAVTILDANGVMAEPTVGFYNDERSVLLEQSLQLAIDCKTSPIDRSLAQLCLGKISEEKEDMARAEKCYSDLLASDSFFAPEGGLHLARVQRAQGKTKEADETYTKIKEQFPGYAAVVDEMSKKDLKDLRINF